MPSVTLTLKKGVSFMTLIVFDSKALVTDSLGMAKFGDQDRMSYQANKILLNASGTVAMAYCGEARPDLIDKWYFKHVEARLVMAELIEIRVETPGNSDIIGKAIKTLADITAKMPHSPAEFNSGIAISRNHAFQFALGEEFKDITYDKYNGSGCHLDTYWMLRQAGWPVARVMEKISSVSAFVGGALNVQLMSALAEPDILDYCMQIIGAGQYNDLTMRDLTLRALVKKPGRKNRKAK